MPADARAIAVRFDASMMWVDFQDGRTLGIPLEWFPRLLRGTAAQRREVSISTSGLHWEELDEDISIEGLLAGARDRTLYQKRAGRPSP